MPRYEITATIELNAESEEDAREKTKLINWVVENMASKPEITYAEGIIEKS